MNTAQNRIKATVYDQPISVTMTRREVLGALQYYRSEGWQVKLCPYMWHFDFYWDGVMFGWISLAEESSAIPCREARYTFNFAARPA